MGKRMFDPLEQADKDVPLDSSTSTPPSDDPGNPPPDGDDKSGDSGKGRTLENVRGELLRKQDELRSELAEIKDLIRNQPAPAVAEPPTTDINKMSSVQLEALRPNVPEAQHAELDRLINKRRIDEAVAQGIESRLSAREVEQVRREANSTAFQRWPELRDNSSTFRRVTNEVLKERGDSTTNPQAVLDAANEAGMRLGLKPATTAFNSNGRGAYRTARGSSDAPAPADAPQDMLSEAEASAIAIRLRNAMPSGKFSPEQVKRARERSGEYRKHQDLFIKK